VKKRFEGIQKDIILAVSGEAAYSSAAEQLYKE